MTKRKAEQAKKPTGRKSKYQPEFDEQARKLCLLGAIDKDLADFFGVNIDTIAEWKNKHPSFSESLKEGKDHADARVQQSLYHRAIGYEHPDVDIKMYKGSIIKTDIIKHYPPDTVAAIFWLKNRKKDEWRERQEIDHTSKGDKIAAPMVYLPQDMPRDIVQPPAPDPAMPTS